MTKEEKYIKNKRGKWSQATVPHKGWSCVDVEDLQSNDAMCEMCESQQIRYAHYMKHSDYPRVLAVGCICAGNMEDNISIAKKRDDKMKSRSAKRKRWLTRKWKISKKGNEYINAYGYNITIFKNGNNWRFKIAPLDNDENELSIFIRKNYNNKDEIKLASFDYISKLLSEG